MTTNPFSDVRDQVCFTLAGLEQPGAWAACVAHLLKEKKIGSFPRDSLIGQIPYGQLKLNSPFINTTLDSRVPGQASL